MSSTSPCHDLHGVCLYMYSGLEVRRNVWELIFICRNGLFAEFLVFNSVVPLSLIPALRMLPNLLYGRPTATDKEYLSGRFDGGFPS